VTFNIHASAMLAVAASARVPILAEGGLAWDEGKRGIARDRGRRSQPMSFKRIGNLRLDSVQALVRDRSPRPSRLIITKRP